MTRNTSATSMPPTNGTLTKEQFTKALTAAGHRPESIWQGEHGVRLRGPSFRPSLDEGGKVDDVRRYYRCTFCEGGRV